MKKSSIIGHNLEPLDIYTGMITNPTFSKLLALCAAMAVIATACSNPSATTASVEPQTTESAPEPREQQSTTTTVPPEPIEETLVVSLFADSPISEALIELTPEHFTRRSGIEVEFFVNDGRSNHTAFGLTDYSEVFNFVTMTSSYEAPQLGATGWISSLNGSAAEDPGYDVNDLLPALRSSVSVDGELFGAPLTGESSLLMYHRDILGAAGLALSDTPTWDEVAEIARTIDTEETAGICLRTRPGWDELGATFTSVLNTFGGTWWDSNDDGSIGEARVDAPEFREALQFYVDLYLDAGQDNPDAGFDECRELFDSGEVAMWYDSTAAAPLLEDGPQAGNIGYALAPANLTDASGWLATENLAIWGETPDPEAAWEFIRWATSREFTELVGETNGWETVSATTRVSTFENPDFIAANQPFIDIKRQALETAPIDNPGTAPRPGFPGIQFVGIPEFPDIGTRCSEEFSAVLTATQTVDDALTACQLILSEVSR